MFTMLARRQAVRALLAAGVALPAWPTLAQGAAAARGGDRPVLGRAGRRVGLLLPHGGGAFEPVARALYAGVAAAHEREGAEWLIEPLAVDDDPQTLAQALKDLAARGGELVLGPVTRKGVNALLELGPLPLPTVALSQPDSSRPVPRRMTLLGLAIESEAQQAATHAMSESIDRVLEHRPRAAAVMLGSPLARRGAQAFENAWRGMGGDWRGAIEWGRTPPAEFATQWAQWAPDVVYAALDAPALRRLRPLLAPRVMTWGAALVTSGCGGARQPELDGIYVMEMPYQVEPDNPAVVSYPRASAALSLELQRLYALGVDAVRVGAQLLGGALAFEIDGLTGWLRYDGAVSPRVERMVVPAIYRGGVPVALAAL